MKFLKILLLPISYLYGSLVFLRNKMYDLGIKRSREFQKPAVISVGNLTVGGTGKTPHIEYLIRLLKDLYKIATLSRGYGRDTSGFVLANETYSTSEIGDEPRQFKHKFKDLIVAVDTSRVRGIKKLCEINPEIQIVLLDDAFQHRAIKPSLSILLTEYNHFFYNDVMLPSGKLREFKSGYKRADIIIVTKTPQIFSPLDKRLIIRNIEPKEYQKVYFSFLKYGKPIAFPAPENKLSNTINPLEKNSTIILLTGIANPEPLEEYLKTKVKEVISFSFPDHHEYSYDDLDKLQKLFNNIVQGNKIIITTEKDTMRLDKPGLKEQLNQLPLFYIPIEVGFHQNDEDELIKQIGNHVRIN